MGRSLLLLLILFLSLAGHVTNTGGSPLRPDLTGPCMAYVKSTASFECKFSTSPSPLILDFIKGRGEILATKFDPQQDQPIKFHVKVNTGSEGEYFCRVTQKGQTRTSNPVHLQVVIPVLGAYIVPKPMPPIIYEGAALNLSCEVKRGTHLTYIWYHNKQQVSPTSPLYHISEHLLRVDRTDERHAGSYSCEAKNVIENNTRHSSSTEVTVVVKKFLSVPRLSFSLYHYGSIYHANISCWSAHGTPPVTFRLLLDDRSVAVQQVDSLQAWFPLPVILGQDMGEVRCIAENDVQQLLSDPVNLKVAPVGGPVRVLVDYLHTADSVVAAALLQCVITRGTFPVFSWSFNSGPLAQDADSHALTHRGNILVLTRIRAGTSGYYSCRVKDSFISNSSWMESEKVLIRITDFKLASVEVIIMAFCCFLFLTTVGGSCCLLRSTNHEHAAPKTYQNVACGEPNNTQKHHAKTQTAIKPHVEEMETLIIEVEI